MRIAELSSRTFCTFQREFSSFAGKGPLMGTLIPDTVLPIYFCDTCPRLFRVHYQKRGDGSRRLTDGHAAAPTNGHAGHDADRLAFTLARRAAAPREVNSAWIVSPVPKYNSSGVCPRSAEFGSTRLFSST
jgi:hypothetical protein